MWCLDRVGTELRFRKGKNSAATAEQTQATTENRSRESLPKSKKIANFRVDNMVKNAKSTDSHELVGFPDGKAGGPKSGNTRIFMLRCRKRGNSDPLPTEEAAQNTRKLKISSTPGSTKWAKMQNRQILARDALIERGGDSDLEMQEFSRYSTARAWSKSKKIENYPCCPGRQNGQKWKVVLQKCKNFHTKVGANASYRGKSAAERLTEIAEIENFHNPKLAKWRKMQNCRNPSSDALIISTGGLDCGNVKIFTMRCRRRKISRNLRPRKVGRNPRYPGDEKSWHSHDRSKGEAP